MKKTIRCVAALLCILTLFPFFAACDGSNDPKNTTTAPYHTITFDTKGGTKIADITVKHGRNATKPTDPTLENYVFCRWERSDGRAFFFDAFVVDEDIHLEAIWIKAEDLFALSAMPDESKGIMITDIKRQEDFNVLYVPKIINGKEVEGIGAEAFMSVIPSHADTIVFPDTIKYIEESAFDSISEVQLVFNSTIYHIEESSFSRALMLNEINLGEGITTIPHRAFYMCTNLKTIDLPVGVTLIEENAFESCSSMRTVVLPASLLTVEDSAFEDCNNLKTVFFGGTQEQFDALNISVGNDAIEEAELYLYSEEQPTTDGNFWHYDKNDKPTIW